jgi:hypothetical protein
MKTEKCMVNLNIKKKNGKTSIDISLLKPKKPEISDKELDKIIKDNLPEVRKGGKQQKTVSSDKVTSPVGATAPEISEALHKKLRNLCIPMPTHSTLMTRLHNFTDKVLQEGIKLGEQRGIKKGRDEAWDFFEKEVWTETEGGSDGEWFIKNDVGIEKWLEAIRKRFKNKEK